MPERQVDIDMAMHDLSQRIRAGWAKKHETAQETVNSAQAAVREQWERDQQQEQSHAQEPPSADKGKQQEIDGPDLG